MLDDAYTRQLVGIMFTDIQGYSQGMARDEKAAFEMLQEHNAIMREQILQHHGEVVKTIGDAVMGKFRSVIWAVHCGVAVQRTLHRRNLNRKEADLIRVRIGIHAGDVMVTKLNDLFGNEVNIAARLEPESQPGQVYITDTVYVLAEGKLDFPVERVGAFRFKNIEREITVFKILFDPEVQSSPPAGADRVTAGNGPYDARDLEGQAIGHYRIESLIGQGGMGIVYRATDLRLGRSVALKFLPYHSDPDSEEVRRFYREASAASALNAPQIAVVYAQEAVANLHFIAMEYVDGETLKDRVRRGPMDIRQILDVAIQVCEGMIEAHRSGIIHRDIKPDNILVTRDNGVKITDFGLAKIRGGASMTRSGAVVGTLAYMSPEQIRGEELDERTDLFSFGVVLYEMLTGALPFSGDSDASVMHSILNTHPPSLASHHRTIPQPFEKIIGRLLAKSRDRRTRDFAALRAQLQQLRDELGTRKMKMISGLGKRRSARRLIWMAAVLMIVISLSIWRLTAGSRGGVVAIYVERLENMTADPGWSDTVEKSLVYSLSQFTKLRVFTSELVDELRVSYFKERETDQDLSTEQALARLEVQYVLSGIIASDDEIIVTFQRLRDGDDLVRHTTVGEGRQGLLENQIDEITRFVVKQLARDHDDLPGRSVSLAQRLTPSFEAFSCYIRAMEQWQRLEVNDAIKNCLCAVELDPGFAVAHLALAEIYTWRTDFAAARESLERAGERIDLLTPLDRWRYEAIRARLDFDFEAEVRALENIVRGAPYDKKSYYDLAEACFHHADITRAVKEYRQALAFEPKFALAHNHLAYCYAYQADFDRAVYHFEEYKNIDESANSYDSLGDGYFYAGDYPKALRMKFKALQLNRAQPWVYKSISDISLLRGELDRALAYSDSLSAAAFGDRDRAEALFQKAYIFHVRGRDSSALQHCRAGLGTYDSGLFNQYIAELHWLHGLLLLDAGKIEDFAAELAWFENIITTYRINRKNYSSPLKYYFHLKAKAALREGDRKGFLRHSRSLLELNEKLGYWVTPFHFAYFAHEIAVMNGAAGDTLAFLETADRALSYNPNYTPTLLRLGEYYQQAGKAAVAQDYFARLSRIWVDADLSQRAKIENQWF